MWGHTFDQMDRLLVEAKGESPADPWGYFDTVLSGIRLARAMKARYRGSRGPNPMRRLLHLRARQSQPTGSRRQQPAPR